MSSKPELPHPGKDGAVAPQSPEQPVERHGGKGVESALRQLRVWEQRRASARVGKTRDKPSPT
jgi:hypothetical protein